MLTRYAKLIENIAQKDLGIEVKAEVILSEHGDITIKTFHLAKELRKNPTAIAEEIASFFKKKNLVEFEDVKNVGAYVNFFISPEHLAQELYKKFRAPFPKRGVKVLVEHTSANPTGPIHIGRARNPIIGDSIARLFRIIGYETTVEYYVNDMGKQVAMLLAALENIEKTLSIEEYTKLYQKAYKNEDMYSNKAAETMRQLVKCNKDFMEFSRKHIKAIMEDIVESLKKINVFYDSFAYESDILCKYGIENATDILGNLLKEDETGAKFIEVEGEKIYLIRKDGTSLYFLRDILYHMDKAKRCDRMINILGEDHKNYGKNLQKVLEDIIGKVPDIVYYSFVSLPEGKMSTRAGRVIYLKDVVEEAISRSKEEIEMRYPNEDSTWKNFVAEKIGAAAVRFNILKVQASKPVVFRWKEALNFEGESAPYIMYSYARACSILRKLGEFEEVSPVNLEEESEIKLLKNIAKFYDIVEGVAKNLEIHHIPRFAIELADSFNDFYRDCPVIGAKGRVRDERATIVTIFKEIMGKVMDIIGIEKLEKM